LQLDWLSGILLPDLPLLSTKLLEFCTKISDTWGKDMNHYLVLVYFICFAVIAGSAFAMMWANIRNINDMYNPTKTTRHPEAPQQGEEVMYVDLTRERLETLYEHED
tara:strand:+ start:271 stop:591 length:321 start_codon:yes stop_codon:yes gene_type:complete